MDEGKTSLGFIMKGCQGMKRKPDLMIIKKPDPVDSTSFLEHFLMIRPNPR